MCTNSLSLDLDIPGVPESLLVHIVGFAAARCKLNCDLSISHHKAAPKAKASILVPKKSPQEKPSCPCRAALLSSLPSNQLLRCPRLLTSGHQHSHRRGGTLCVPKPLRAGLYSSFPQKGQEQAMAPGEMHPFLCRASGAEAWQSSLPAKSLSQPQPLWFLGECLKE